MEHSQQTLGKIFGIIIHKRLIQPKVYVIRATTQNHKNRKTVDFPWNV